MIELAIRSTAILAVAWLLTRTLPRATAATRHLIWHLALLAVVAAPLLVPLTPQFTFATLAKVPSVPMVPMVREVLDVIEAPQIAAVSESTQGTLGSVGTLGLLGTLGTLALALWFCAGWIAAARAARRATPAPVAWQLELNALCERLHMACEVRLGIIAASTSPVAIGLTRSTVLLPPMAASWTADRRRAVLLHELAHIRRGDCRVQLITQAACALYWFNPFIWLAAAQLRTERERACDDEVLRVGTRPSDYASHLLAIARHLRPRLRPTAALAMARSSQLEGRLLAVLAERRARVPARATRWTVALAMAVTTAAAFGATPGQPDRAAAPASSSRVVRHLGLTADLFASQERSSEAGDAVAALQQALKDGNQDVREKAAMALAFMSGADVVPALVEALGDRNSQVREKAAIGLALRRDERVVEPLLAAMKDSDAQVREKAAIALGSSGDARAAAALTRALRDPDSQVREKAAAGLTLLALVK